MYFATSSADALQTAGAKAVSESVALMERAKFRHGAISKRAQYLLIIITLNFIVSSRGSVVVAGRHWRRCWTRWRGRRASTGAAPRC